jgi:hypothetical protein
MKEEKIQALKDFVAGKISEDELSRLIKADIVVSSWNYGFKIKTDIDDTLCDDNPCHKPSYTISSGERTAQIRFENFNECKEFQIENGFYPVFNGIDFYLKEYDSTIFEGLTWEGDASEVLYWKKDKSKILELIKN